MTQAEFEAFVTGLENVQREENLGYSMYFVGDDHRLPFVTFANSDHDFDNVSNLDRAEVFRINIGVSRETFERLISDPSSKAVDYSMLDTFLPHPDYSKQHWVCILSPFARNIEATKELIVEAHSIAAARAKRSAKD
jgi:hypothetical protein